MAAATSAGASELQGKAACAYTPTFGYRSLQAALDGKDLPAERFDMGAQVGMQRLQRSEQACC